MTTNDLASHRLGAAALAAAAACIAAGPALAQQEGKSPWYIGLSQTFQHETNVLRLRDAQAPVAGRSRSDDLSSTALIGGVDQRLGRQRLTGSVSLQENRYDDNDYLDYRGYAAKLGLDWETIGALSGNVNLGGERVLRQDLRGADQASTAEQNLETTTRASFTAGIGIAGPWRIEGGAGMRRTRYSAGAVKVNDVDVETASIATRYRLGGATTVGIGLRRTNTESPNEFGAQFDNSRDDIDLLATWVPTGTSRLDLRLSQGETEYDRRPTQNFEGNSGSLTYSYDPGGRLKLRLRVAREIGQEGERSLSALSRRIDTLQLEGDYEVTAKIRLTASHLTYRRQQQGEIAQALGPFLIRTPVDGRDTTNVSTLGLRWDVLRSVALGCNYAVERRGHNTQLPLEDAYRAETVGCFGQFVLQ